MTEYTVEFKIDPTNGKGKKKLPNNITGHEAVMILSAVIEISLHCLREEINIPIKGAVDMIVAMQNTLGMMTSYINEEVTRQLKTGQQNHPEIMDKIKEAIESLMERGVIDKKEVKIVNMMEYKKDD